MQKAQHEKAKRQVRDVLDQQVALRVELREKNKKESEEFDKRLIEQARRELELEKKQKADVQQKVMEQKKMRDIMLAESK